MALNLLKFQAKKLEKNYPKIFKLLRSTYQNAQYLKAYGKSRLLVGTGNMPETAILIVNTSRIQYGNFDGYGKRLLEVDRSFRGISSIKGGDWDLQKTRIEDMDIYKAAEQYLIHGKDIRKTNYYAGKASSENLITTGAWYKIYEQNYEENINRLDQLYESIKTNGYKSQEELGNENTLDEIMIRIGRDGEILFENSIHRLVVAKILNVPYVTTVVTTRHSKWMKIRRHFYEYAKMRHGGKLYGKPPHPDLWDIPHSHECDDRVELLAPYLAKLQKGNALEIGADLGIFSHALEDLGFESTAVEKDEELGHYIRLLRDIEGKKFEIIIGDALTPETQQKMCSKKYSVVIGLNIFHHFIKDPESYKNFIRLLNNLDMEAMIFQGHTTDEPQMQNVYLNPEAEEFVALIIENSCLNKSEYIGSTAVDSRKIFLLTK